MKILLAPRARLERAHGRKVSGAAPDHDVELTVAPDPSRLSKLLISGEYDIAFATYLPDGPAPSLKWLQLSSAGVDSGLMSPVWQDPSVAITTSNGIHARPMSQWAIAMILYQAQRLQETLAFKSTRLWPGPRDYRRMTSEVLAGKVMGIIGYGSVGRECGRLGQALGLKVLAVSRFAAERTAPRLRYRPPRSAAERPDEVEILTLPQLPKLLQRADYLVLTVPLTSETRGLIGKAQFELMKRSTFLINLSRGAIVDEDALLEALSSKQLRGAALDVFANEPLAPTSPLFDLPNAILSPHVSGRFEGYWDAAIELFCDNLRRFAANEPLLNLVDRRLGY